MYNNDEAVTGSSLRSLLKVLYYQAFAVVYGIAGACSGGSGWLVSAGSCDVRLSASLHA
jgi:hypothetical protein